MSAPASPNHKPPFWTIARRDAAAGYVFIAPQLIGIITFVLVPLGLVFWYSLHEWNVLASSFNFVGAANYQMLLADPNLPSVLIASAIFSAGLVVLNMSLALLLAVLLDQKLKGMVVFRTLFFSPVVVSLVAWTIVWSFLLQANGGINGMLALVGIEGPNWLRTPTTAMISVIVVQVFKNVGLNMVLFLAALQGVPQELYDAAQTDGANAWNRFRHVTVPMISPTTFFLFILQTIGAFQLFTEPFVMTGGGPANSSLSVVMYIYYAAFRDTRMDKASAMAWFLFLFIFAFTLLQNRLQRRWVYYEAG